MHRLHFNATVVIGFALFALMLPSNSHAAEPRVEFEIVTESGLTPATTQKWFKTLTDLKVAGLRIRGETANDEPKIETSGTKDRPVFHVIGRITARGMLIVPGGQFSTEDRARIGRWIAELSNNGVQGVSERKGAFGLTSQQVAELTDDLMQPVGFATKGMKPTDAARKIVAALKLETKVDDAVKRALAADDPVRDELEGLSSGTALAAILRPAGAGLVPEKPAGHAVQYHLVDAGRVQDLWPVGWPAEKQPAKAVPKLFEFLNAEIEGVSAAEAIEAIHGRLGVPFLFDHNNMARQRIDLTTEVAVPAKRSYYSRVLEQVLFKAGLKYELRVDENEKPFVWITTLKR